MENLMTSLAGFLVCAAVIIYSGQRLSFYGDQIADITGMGKAWVGLMLMPLVTTLPELVTGISAVAIVKEPDLAAGSIFGSCVFNLLILSALDARIKKPLFSLVKSSHLVAAIFGIILLVIAGIAIHFAWDVPNVFWISSNSLLLLGGYVVAMYGIYKFEKREMLAALPADKAPEPPSPIKPVNLKTAISGYAFNALVVVSAALFLPYFGDKIAHHTGLGNSFFGTLFIAAATSLPELAVSFAALRMNMLDMAVGNMLGSNLFNMFILGLDDVFYREGSLFRSISSSHMLSVFITIIMSAVVGLSLLFKPKRKQLWLLSIDTFILVVLYLLMIGYLFNKK